MLVTSPQGYLTSRLDVVHASYRKFRVAGISSLPGFYQYDFCDSGFLRTLGMQQRLFSEPDLITMINFKVDDMNHADVIGQEIEKAAGKGFQTTNWMDENRPLFRALALEKIVTFIYHCADSMLVAALNILDRPDNDGDGEDAGYRSADELWRAA